MWKNRSCDFHNSNFHNCVDRWTNSGRFTDFSYKTTKPDLTEFFLIPAGFFCANYTNRFFGRFLSGLVRLSKNGNIWEFPGNAVFFSFISLKGFFSKIRWPVFFKNKKNAIFDPIFFRKMDIFWKRKNEKTALQSHLSTLFTPDSRFYKSNVPIFSAYEKSNDTNIGNFARKNSNFGQAIPRFKEFYLKMTEIKKNYANSILEEIAPFSKERSGTLAQNVKQQDKKRSPRPL